MYSTKVKKKRSDCKGYSILIRGVFYTEPNKIKEIKKYHIIKFD
jgi:hypothetical protein